MTDREITERIDNLISLIQEEYRQNKRPVNDETIENPKRVKLN